MPKDIIEEIRKQAVKAFKASGNGSHNAFDRLMMLVGEETQATTSEQEKQANLLKAIQEAVKNGD